MSSGNDKFTGPYVPRSKYSKKAFFAYLPKESSFQQGYLGIGRQSIIAGVFHLRYSDEKPIFVKKVQVSFTGKECIYFTSRLEEEEKKEQKNGNHDDDSDDDDDNDDYCNNDDGSTAMISNHRAKRKIFQASICLWKSQHKGHYEGVKSLDLPFKLKLPDDLPPSICIDKGYGRIYYVLKAEVSRQPINPESRNRNKVFKVVVPIARFSLISPVLSSRWLVKNEKPASLHVVGYDISLSNSIFKPNTKVVIPVKLYFYEPHVYLKNIMVGLKEYHELRTNKHEILVKNYLIQKTVTPSLHLIPSFNTDNGYHLEISFMIPPERLLAYTVDSTYLTVSHKIKIKVNLGRAPDISLSKSVKIENVVSEDEINSSLPDKIETPEIVRTSYTSSKYSTPNRLSPYLPAILNKFYALDPIAKKRLSKQLQRHIADSKNSGTIYNSRTVIIP